MQDWVGTASAQPVPEAPGGFRSVPAAVLAACCEGDRPLDPARIEGAASWAAPLAVFGADGLRARAIDCAEALVDTGLAFHNYVADFVAGCQSGTMHLFVIEECGGRDVAVAALTVFASVRQWGLMDVKGVCNAQVPEKVRQFAVGLLEAFNRRRGA